MIFIQYHKYVFKLKWCNFPKIYVFVLWFVCFFSLNNSILFWKLCWLLWGKICPRLIWGFSEVTEVDKREPRESFSKPRPHFWGRGRRPRPRNEQAEAEKCSPRFPFVYWGNTGKNSNQRSKIFWQTCHRKKTEQNTFFTFLGFFVEFWLLVELTYIEIWKI